ncbi:M15 family metallopeptidase [Undibacterium sp.]|uniref:M15 family metallopeptidase n=1 Tax=Undibacterium sp. TaxID=1914977 RepID=UPI00374D78C0
MLFLIVSLYFLLACVAAWLLLFPSGRETLAAAIARVGTLLERKISSLETGAAKTSAMMGNTARFGAGQAARTARKHYPAMLICAAILGVPPLVAMLASQRNTLDGFDAPAREVNLQIAELLKGEQLVAPAPLPPAIFATQEVLQERPLLGSASRNWELLNADFMQRLLLVFKIMKEKHGYDMAIIEGYRSPERQDMLAKLGSSVTNAAAFQSYHQYGLAADCAFIRDGKLVISEKDPWAMKGYELYGEVAESVGLTWGGHWKLMDFGHTELRLPHVLKK